VSSISDLLAQWAAIAVVAGFGIFFAAGGLAILVAAAQWCLHLLRFVPLEWSGYVATATFTGCRKDGDRLYVPLVTFVTRRGETRSSVSIWGTRYTDPPLLIDQPYGGRQLHNEVFSWSDDETARAPAPPIGHPAIIVYDPKDAGSVSFRTSRSIILVLFGIVWLAGILSLPWTVPWIVASIGPWIDATTLAIAGFTICASLAFAFAFTGAAMLLDHLRYRRLERAGHVATATAGIRWNAISAKYEPALSFSTPVGQPRYKTLAESYDFGRLPDTSTLTVVYDPSDANFIEPCYADGRSLRPTTQVAIGVIVAAFTISLVPATFLFAPFIRPFGVAAAMGLALGVLAAAMRTTGGRIR
jgi:hypothetical protein